MNTKHINGPWRIGTPGPNGCYTVGTQHGLMVAVVAHSINAPNQLEAAIAHASLIAAAPELLEILVEVLDKVPLTDSSRYVTQTAAKARAVIAKATGASHVHDQ